MVAPLVDWRKETHRFLTTLNLSGIYILNYPCSSDLLKGIQLLTSLITEYQYRALLSLPNGPIFPKLSSYFHVGLTGGIAGIFPTSVCRVQKSNPHLKSFTSLWELCRDALPTKLQQIHLKKQVLRHSTVLT